MRDDAEAAILRAHSSAHLEHVRGDSVSGGGLPGRIDLDTVVSAGSWEAALRAIGAGLRAVDAVMDPHSGPVQRYASQCALSPPVTSQVAPLTIRASSEARKTTTGATSCGSIQGMLSGIFLISAASACFSS